MAIGAARCVSRQDREPRSGVAGRCGPRDRAGELKLLTSILRDLREQKTVESRLRESEAALRALNSQLQDRAAVCAAVAHDLDSPLITIDEDARRVLEEYGPRLPEEARALTAGAVWRRRAQLRSLIDAFLSNSH